MGLNGIGWLGFGWIGGLCLEASHSIEDEI